MIKYSLGMIMLLVLTYRFLNIGPVEVKWRNWSAASVEFCCICGQPLSVCVCVCLHCPAYCQIAHSLCSKANMKEVHMCVCITAHKRKQKRPMCSMWMIIGMYAMHSCDGDQVLMDTASCQHTLYFYAHLWVCVCVYVCVYFRPGVSFQHRPSQSWAPPVSWTAPVPYLPAGSVAFGSPWLCPAGSPSPFKSNTHTYTN